MTGCPTLTVMEPLPLAHSGHWAVGLIYLAPVVLLLVVLFVQGRREEEDEEADDLPPEPLEAGEL